MEQIIHSSSEPEIKINNISIDIQYREESLIKKNKSISTQNITFIKFRIHKIGIGFWLLVMLSLFLEDSSGDDYESNDELIINTSDEIFYFTFYKNLSRKDRKALIAKLESQNIKVKIQSK